MIGTVRSKQFGCLIDSFYLLLLYPITADQEHYRVSGLQVHRYVTFWWSGGNHCSVNDLLYLQKYGAVSQPAAFSGMGVLSS